MQDRAKIKYCQWQKGHLYFSVRRPDGTKSYIRLPDPSSVDFAASYAALVEEHEGVKHQRAEARKPKPTSSSNIISNTFKALVFEAERSRAYRSLAPATRENADRYYAIIVAEWGDRLVASLEPAEVDRRLDQPDMAEFPGRALNYIKHLKGLIDLGIRRGYRPDKYNPARGVDQPETGEREPWPDEVYEEVVERSSDMLRLAVQLGVYTGQRISDCLPIDRDELLACAASGEPMHVVQQKTGVDVYIPIHPDLAALVEAYPPSPRCRNVLYNRYGDPFPKPDQIQDRLKKLMLELGHFEEVTVAGEVKQQTLFKFHGLRKLAACHLAEVSASPHEIGAICGMNIKTVMHYTRGVAKKQLSRGTAERMSTIRPGRQRPGQRRAA